MLAYLSIGAPVGEGVRGMFPVEFIYNAERLAPLTAEGFIPRLHLTG
jgi:hypothetical protein